MGYGIPDEKAKIALIYMWRFVVVYIYALLWLDWFGSF